MKKLVALLLAAFSALSQAAVVSVDINGDLNKTAFLDQANNLLWTNGNLFAKNGLTYANANSGINGLNTSSFEGITNWRLPTIAEFTSLYNTQGNVAGKMNRDPFTIQSNHYWTTDLNKEKHWGFGFNALNQTNSYADHITLNVWAVSAVSPVPEPETYVMLLSGLGLIGYAARRRKINTSK
jgi:hypothetical protein